MSVFVNGLAPPHARSQQGQCVRQCRRIMKDTLHSVFPHSCTSYNSLVSWQSEQHYSCNYHINIPAHYIVSTITSWQWCQCSGVTGGGAKCPPETSDWEIFAYISGKKRQGKKLKRGKNWEEKKENCKREGGKLEMEVGKVIKRGEDFFFFAFHFWKRRKFVLGLPKREFSTGKNHFTSGKKSGKMTLPPQKNMPVTPLCQCNLRDVLCGRAYVCSAGLESSKMHVIHESLPTWKRTDSST